MEGCAGRGAADDASCPGGRGVQMSTAIEEPPVKHVGTPWRNRPRVEYVTPKAPELGETMTVNMGPQHPSTHGVLRLEIDLAGEEVHDIRCHIGYMHRCAEKEAENST